MSNLTVENVYTRHAAKALTHKHFWKLLGMMLIVVVITYAVMFGCTALASGLVSSSEALAVVLGLVAMLVTWLVASGLGLGLTSAMLYICRDGQHVKVSDVFSRMGQSLKAFGLMLWVGLKTLLWMLPGYVLMIGVVVSFAVGIDSMTGTVAWSESEAGTLALCVYGSLILIFALVIPAAMRYMLSTYILADKPETGVFDCVRQSKAMMKGHKWQAFKLAVPMVLLMLLAEFFMALGYSLLVALPGEASLSVASIVLLIGWIALMLYFYIRMGLGYCLFYIKRCKEQEASVGEAAE